MDFNLCNEKFRINIAHDENEFCSNLEEIRLNCCSDYIQIFCPCLFSAYLNFLSLFFFHHTIIISNPTQHSKQVPIIYKSFYWFWFDEIVDAKRDCYWWSSSSDSNTCSGKLARTLWYFNIWFRKLITDGSIPPN